MGRTKAGGGGEDLQCGTNGGGMCHGLPRLSISSHLLDKWFLLSTANSSILTSLGGKRIASVDKFSKHKKIFVTREMSIENDSSRRKKRDDYT